MTFRDARLKQSGEQGVELFTQRENYTAGHHTIAYVRANTYAARAYTFID